MSFAKHAAEETHHATGNRSRREKGLHLSFNFCRTSVSAAMSTWKKISFFVAIPSVIFCSYNAYVKEKEHEKHLEEHGRHFAPWPHLRVRSKVL